jgi:hypothetical protein
MKVLSVQQPWASLICAGIKDVENRSWKAAKVPGRILILCKSFGYVQIFLCLFEIAIAALFQSNYIHRV